MIDEISRRLPLFLLLALAVLAGDSALSQLLAQAPFGGPRPSVALNCGPLDALFPDLMKWVFARQAEFYRSFSGLIRAARTDGSAVTTLLGVSFLYGIFHAAGPGHGKAVISSYVIANDETARRGIVLSFASAALQAVVAVAVVGIFVGVFNAAASARDRATFWIETLSYLVIVFIGLRLVWSKGRGLLRAWRAAPAAVPHDHHHDHAHHDHHHDHGHAHHHGHHHGHDHAHDYGHDHGHAHHHHHDHDDHSGHSHGPEPSELAGPGGWQRGLAAIFAVGLRPCSGAIIVLVFAMAQGLFWAGVAATFVMALGTAITVTAIALLAIGAKGLARRIGGTGDGRGMLLLRVVEFGAAVLVLLLGLGLLIGFIVAEGGLCT